MRLRFIFSPSAFNRIHRAVYVTYHRLGHYVDDKKPENELHVVCTLICWVYELIGS
jgi:hypothetical protein